MDLSNFRLVTCYDFSGALVDYRVFSNPEAAEKFRNLYNEKYENHSAYVNPLRVYDSVMEEQQKPANVLFMSDV